MKKNKDDVIIEVRRARANVAKERAKDPKKFHTDTQQIMQSLGMKKSELKPIKIDFSKFDKKKSESDDEAA
jgi:hypothetical protein